MSDRKTFLLASGLLLLVVAVVGALWMSSRDVPSSMAEVGLDVRAAASDPAREAIPLDHPDPIPMTVYMSPQCGCCGLWVDHVKEHGFEPEVRYQDDMAEVKRTFRVPWELSSCHTAIVNGYVIEGHVPGGDIRRLLAEAPGAHGLTVPGMPAGSPGMEMPDGRVDEYEVLTMGASGGTEVFARYGAVPPSRY
jgi:hypothetical protein